MAVFVHGYLFFVIAKVTIWTEYWARHPTWAGVLQDDPTAERCQTFATQSSELSEGVPRSHSWYTLCQFSQKAVDVVSKKNRQSRRLCLSQPNLRKNVLALRAVAHLAVTLKAVAKHLDTACERVRLVLSLRVVQIVLLLFHNLFTLKLSLAFWEAFVNYTYLMFCVVSDAKIVQGERNFRASECNRACSYCRA